MKDLIINKTDSTPKVVFRSNGYLLIEGRSYVEDPTRFFKEILDWAQNMKSKDVTFDIMLDYLNTSSSKCVYQLIKAIDENPSIKTLNIHWHYDDDDEEIRETGEIYAELCSKAKFEYRLNRNFAPVLS